MQVLIDEKKNSNIHYITCIVNYNYFPTKNNSIEIQFKKIIVENNFLIKDIKILENLLLPVYDRNLYF